MLTAEQRKTLLRIAREAITAKVAGRNIELKSADFDEALRRPAGAFVTLSTGEGDLRGCIGSLLPVAPLFEAVAQSAVNAAFRDPRFRPVGSDEIAGLELEISVMGPIEHVEDVSEIEVGRDGLIMSRGHNSGLLLPQVATDYAWDLETFLSQTCVKAGLPPDSWRNPGTRIQRFSAEVFGEANT